MKPTLKSPNKATAVPEKVAAKDDAIKAVKRYEKARDILFEMKKEFETNYSEAHQFLQSILQQEDIVRELIKTAHPLVQAAKESIGDFTCQRKWATAGYDEEKLTSLLKELDNGAEVIQGLLSEGVIEKIVLSDSAIPYFARHPEIAKAFENAWQDKKEKTAAVTCPKL